ncbi:MAG: hypothetical protein MK135_14575 [Polyangiaceae bacterium]|nr:hypothetical protein [Polyangiaceae bacterium]
MNARLEPVSTSELPATPTTKEVLIAQLEGLLQKSFELRSAGVAHARQTEAQGYVDGFMQALTVTGLFTDQELISIVQGARRGTHGPATTRAQRFESDLGSSARILEKLAS